MNLRHQCFRRYIVDGALAQDLDGSPQRHARLLQRAFHALRHSCLPVHKRYSPHEGRYSATARTDLQLLARHTIRDYASLRSRALAPRSTNNGTKSLIGTSSNSGRDSPTTCATCPAATPGNCLANRSIASPIARSSSDLFIHSTMARRHRASAAHVMSRLADPVGRRRRSRCGSWWSCDRAAGGQG